MGNWFAKRKEEDITINNNTGQIQNSETNVHLILSAIILTIFIVLIVSVCLYFVHKKYKTRLSKRILRNNNNSNKIIT